MAPGRAEHVEPTNWSTANTRYFFTLLAGLALAGCRSEVAPLSTNLLSFAVVPAAASVPQGGTIKLIATGQAKDGSSLDLTESVVWTSDAPSIVSVDRGVAKALHEGAARVSASAGELHAEAVVTVLAVAPVSLALSPDKATLATGLSGRFQVTATLASDGTLSSPPASVVWNSTNPAVASIDATGLVTAVREGTCKITASAGSLNGTATITVTPPMPASLMLDPTTAAIAKGFAVRFKVTAATMSDGSAGPPPASVSWSSSSPVVAIDAGGLATGRLTGSATITATAGSATGTAALTVGPPVPIALTVAPPRARIAAGLQQQFAVSGLLLSDGSATANSSPVTWGSSTPAVATVNETGIASSSAPGTTVVTATVGSFSGSASLQVDLPSLVSISVTPKTFGLAKGVSLQLRALGTYSDGTERDVASSIAWTSSADAVATVSATGTVRAVARGSVTITGSSGTLAAVATGTVTEQRVAFVASQTGSGDFSTWQYARGATGLAAADAVCNGSASAAGLPGKFKAWMSDSNDDAYCRIHDRLGKRASNCGAGTLPDYAGPWSRSDGQPVAASLADLLAGRILNPINHDEKGAVVSDLHFPFTATDPRGALFVPSAGTCSEWTSASGALKTWTGSSSGTTVQWTVAGSWECSNRGGLLCFETGLGSGVPLSPWQTPGKRVFVTSVAGNGQLGSWADAGGKSSLEAGDTICANRATAAGLQGTFRAWLSADSTSAPSRFTSDGPWVRPDGILVAASKAELPGGIRSPINVDEFGNYHGQESAWTGTSIDGSPSVRTCGAWTLLGDATSVGLQGIVCDTGSDWTEQFNWGCASPARLYCFEQ